MKMKTTLLILVLSLFVCSSVLSSAQERTTQAAPVPASPRLQRIVDAAAHDALEKFKDKGFAEKNLAITLVDLTDPQRAQQASFRGAEPIYPASVVKLFYLVAAHRSLDRGRTA